MRGHFTYIPDDKLNRSSKDPEVQAVCRQFLDGCMQILAADMTPLGSGFVPLTGRMIVTDWHVVEAHQTLRVRSWNEQILPARVQHVNKTYDLASIYIPPNFPAIKALSAVTNNYVRSDDLQIGTEVIALGFPAARPSPHATCATVHSILPLSDTPNLIPKTEDPDRTMILIEGIVPVGLSGCPIFRLSDAAFIGTVSSSAAPTRFALVEPAEDVLYSMGLSNSCKVAPSSRLCAPSAMLSYCQRCEGTTAREADGCPACGGSLKYWIPEKIWQLRQSNLPVA